MCITAIAMYSKARRAGFPGCLGAGTYRVRLWVRDGASNTGFAETSLTVEEPWPVRLWPFALVALFTAVIVISLVTRLRRGKSQ
jgi:hypothetical protein